MFLAGRCQSRDLLLHRGPLCAAVLALALLPALGCGSSESPSEPTGAVFQIRVCRGSQHAPEGEVFRVLIRDRDAIRQAQTLIGEGNRRIVGGPLLAGDGGFNQPWSWHIDPDEVGFSEGAIEVCDGCPGFVEADLDYWLNTLGFYCPWSTEVISQQR